MDAWTDDEEERKRRKDRERAIEKWEAEEKARYELLRQKAEATALERAEKKLPNSIDISLLGGGWAFLLEFSTVIVIIFTLLIFGINGKIERKDIATKLASIAGYVLGKATAGPRQPEKTMGSTPTTGGGK